jgi:nucleoside 2-deoxyribosyltransferase
MQYYIATTLSNHKAHNILRDLLEKKGHKITYDWTLTLNAEERNGLSMDDMRTLCDKEMNGVNAADAVIVLLPGGKGTHVELGIGLANYAEIFIFSENIENFEACKKGCPFYHAHWVQRFLSPMKADEGGLESFAEYVHKNSET